MALSAMYSVWKSQDSSPVTMMVPRCALMVISAQRATVPSAECLAEIHRTTVKKVILAKSPRPQATITRILSHLKLHVNLANSIETGYNEASLSNG